MSYNLITITGPTATGKTGLAVALAKQLNAEIISADSRQVYKHMDIGTGKDIEEYTIDGVTIPHHLIDVLHPSEEFNLNEFINRFHTAYKDIRERNKPVILCGGTGLYVSGIVQNYALTQVDFSSPRFKELEKLNEQELAKILKSLKPELHNSTDLTVKHRIIKAIIIAETPEEKMSQYPTINSLVIGVNPGRDVVKKRITARLKSRLENGMIEEAEKLKSMGITGEKLDFFGLEYRYLNLYLEGELSYNDMYQKLNSAIHSFAKRQMTWFRKMEKEGISINWLNSPNPLPAYDIIAKEKDNFEKGFFDE